MRKDFGKQTLLLPMPVLMIGSFDEKGKANLMNAAWGGIYDTNKIIICLGSHRTTENIKKSKAFTVSFATRNTVTQSDYVGIVSQDKEPNKLDKAGFHVVKSNRVNAPLFEEYPLTLECELEDMINEGEGGGNIIGRIVNVSADESVLSDGKIDVAKVDPILFDTIGLKYRSLGDVVANAFTEGKKIK